MENRSFESLDLYKRMCVLRKKIYHLTKAFPPEEKYKLCDQIIRSTRKYPANIAEGHGRFHYKENMQFCRIARGSLSETIDHLNCAFECEYISEEELQEYKTEIIIITKMLNSYIRYISSQSQEKNEIS